MTPTEFAEDVFAGIRQQLAGRTNIWSAEADEMVQTAAARLKDCPPETAIGFSLAGLRLIRQEQGVRESWFGSIVNQAVGQVLRRKLPFTEDQVVELIDLVSMPHQAFPYKSILKAVESLPLSPRIAEALRRLRPYITEYLGGTDMRDLHARIDLLLGGPRPDTSLEAQGAWSQTVFSEIPNSPQRVAWEGLFLHTTGLKSSEAPQKWRATARKLIDEIGSATFLEAAARWLSLGPSPGRPGVQVSSGEAEYQKGFVWCLAGQTDPRLPALIAGFAEGALRKIPMLGAVSQKVGNACVNVLAELPGREPVSRLSRLAQRIRYDTAQRLIEEALARAAQKAGVTREQLEEMSVPDCGLGPGGTLTGRFGDYLASVSIEETTSAVLGWSDPQGKPLKSVPAYVKEHHSGEWKELQATVKEIEKMLSAHRTRIERLLLTQRAIPVETLCTCYLDHPLLADMSRRLIWQFEGGTGIWHDGRVIDDTEHEIDLRAQKSARLWHPAASSLETIFHWRCWLEDHQIRQPFKQAHREVYVLTDAERQTGTFSNRFAAHLVRQHRFSALCEQRGWSFKLMGAWDSHNNPALELPEFGLSVEYDVDFPSNEKEVSGHAVFLLIRTGAVRFRRAGSLPQVLESVPPVVFSEVMRDLDLFTSVAGIGADPAWGLTGSNPFKEYWQAATFGELTEMARNRGAVLERIVPRLAIKDRCHVDGRFLVVRGDRGTYQIHLGSGNVLLEGRALCIVEGAATKSTPRDVFLPFEGDHGLAVILSKAFLLANDRKIKDETILRQFPPG